MADIDFTVADIRPLNGAITRRGVAGATLTPGQVVYLDGANGWKLADADALASSQGKGIVVGGGHGGSSYAAGEAVDICVFGPVEGFTSMTPGGLAYASTTAGDMDQTKPATAGDYPCVIGWAESASIFFVDPQNTLPVVNS